MSLISSHTKKTYKYQREMKLLSSLKNYYICILKLLSCSNTYKKLEILVRSRYLTLRYVIKCPCNDLKPRWQPLCQLSPTATVLTCLSSSLLSKQMLSFLNQFVLSCWFGLENILALPFVKLATLTFLTKTTFSHLALFN